jgi:signal transduction histidine kinase
VLKRIWKPFHDILNKLRNFNLTDYQDSPVIKTKVSEFNKLGEAVSSLLQRTAATFNSQKQFIENASHELQTPLAISVNKLELLAEKHSFSDDQLHDISSVIQSLERLARLNKTLLLLSKIENRQFAEQIPVNFNQLADRLVMEFSDLMEFKSVAISITHEENLIQTLNPELAGIMVSNLLKNAIIHNQKGGSVLLKIKSSGITIENTSTSSALDPARIFERFYKEASSASSTGLGLAIVKSIADYYGYLIKYAYNGKHVFSIIINDQKYV